MAGYGAWTADLIIAGAFWCMREIELSLAVWGSIVITAVPPRVVWTLPTSKTDPQALGARREWECVCSDRAPGPCGCCAVIRQWRRAHRQGSPPPPDAPVFPDRDGGVLSKERAVTVIRAAAEALGLALLDSAGHHRFGGRSLRVTGAQHLARIGISIVHIQLLARWESAIVLRYVAEAPLAVIGKEYREKWARHTLEDFVAASGPELARLREAVGALPSAAAIRELIDGERDALEAPGRAGGAGW